jgi:L-asparaginase
VREMMANVDAQGVLLIYTGGTLGSLPEDKNDPLSPLVPAPLEEIMKMIPRYDSVDKKLPLAGMQVRLGTHSWEEPLDSSNITSTDWLQMASVVRQHYNDYEGFVILHGTDTLAYTASALAFILTNLDRPVIVTGSQRPIGELRSDAVQNLVTSIEIAAARTLGKTVVPEVAVFFRDKLYRGCRTTKFSASNYSAFDSPNYPALAVAGEHVVADDSAVGKWNEHALHVEEALETNIACMNIFPGMSPALLESMLNAPSLRGIVLQTFGTGNAPSTPEFLDTIERAVNAGRVIVDITQCRSGEVELGLYEVSAGLLSRGVITGMDMTPEAALTKLAVVLGSEADPAVAADTMQLNHQGEQRQSVFHLHFGAGEVPEDGAVTVDAIGPMVRGLEKYQSGKLDRALLRITGLHIPQEKRGALEFKIFIDMPDATADTSEAEPQYLGEVAKKWRDDEGKANAFLPVTAQAKAFVDNRHTNSLRIVTTSGAPVAWEKLDLAFYADC